MKRVSWRLKIGHENWSFIFWVFFFCQLLTGGEKVTKSCKFRNVMLHWSGICLQQRFMFLFFVDSVVSCHNHLMNKTRNKTISSISKRLNLLSVDPGVLRLSHQGKTTKTIVSSYVNLLVNFHFFDRATSLFFEFFCRLPISGWLDIFTLARSDGRVQNWALSFHFIRYDLQNEYWRTSCTEIPSRK